MSSQDDHGYNPGRMCLNALDSLQANMPPRPRVPAMHLPQTDTISRERHVSKYQSRPFRDSNAASNGLGEMSFAQYCVAISAEPGDVQHQNVSSAFSDFSVNIETAAPVRPKRRIYAVPSYSVLARFLPKFSRGKNAVDERQSGDGKKCKKTRLRRFLKKCRRRMGMKQQEASVGRPAVRGSKKDSVIEPAKESCAPGDCVQSPE